MGKGDKKSKKGKRFTGSYGRIRIRKVKKETFMTHIKDEIEVKKTSATKKSSSKEKITKKEE